MSRLEKATNIAIIIACLFLVGSLLRNYYISKELPPQLPQIQKGTVINLPVPNWGEGQTAVPTLVMVLSKECHFCNDSIPFYQKLTAVKNSTLQRLRLVAVLPDKQEDAEAYLNGNGIGVDAVLSMPVTNLGVQGTPTLLLLDAQNRMEEIWVGKMDESGESQVIERLKKATGL
jgi:hypothetical protein